jgi:hypothetical protein
MFEAASNEGCWGHKRDLLRLKTFFPVLLITPDDRFDAVLINLGMALTDFRGGCFLYNRLDDLPLFFQRDL